MSDEPMTEEEARRRFVAELMESRAQGPAPDCAERLAAINAEFDAECTRKRRRDGLIIVDAAVRDAHATGPERLSP